MDFQELSKLAIEGIPEYQFLLGQHFEQQEDLKMAFFWYQQSANQNFALGINAIASFYTVGSHVQQNIGEAIRLFTKIQKELPIAKYNLGAIYLKGEGCKADTKQALHLWEEAVSEGCGIAALDLGNARLSGMYKVPVNYTEAVKWFEKAYELEEYESVYYLCGIYEGRYSQKLHDKHKAKHWLAIRDKLIAEGKLPETDPTNVNDQGKLYWSIDKDGREYFCLDNGVKLYHDEIVASLYLPQPEDMDSVRVKHIDGNPLNCAIENLRYVRK